MKTYEAYSTYKNATNYTFKADTMHAAAVMFADRVHRDKDDVHFINGVGYGPNPARYYINAWGTIYVNEVEND